VKEKVRGVYRFSSLVKQKIKGKNYAVFCFAGKKKLLFYIYAVIVKQIFYKRSTNHYWRPLLRYLGLPGTERARPAEPSTRAVVVPKLLIPWWMFEWAV
jgi:hypothetical protein